MPAKYKVQFLLNTYVCIKLKETERNKYIVKYTFAAFFRKKGYREERAAGPFERPG
jgi:hypothetical protein